MKKGLTPVVGYVRVSRVGDRSGDSFLSPALQRDSIARVAARHGLRIVRVIEELDESGGNPNRPGWLEAIDAVKRGEVKGLACWNLARFSRSLKDGLNAFEQIEAAGGRLYTEEGDLDKLSRNIRLAISEDERLRAALGFKRAVGSAIERGIYVAPRVPLGYKRGPDRRLTPDPATAPLVKALFERRAAGQSWAELGAFAAEMGRPLAKTSLSWIVGNPVYLGQARNGSFLNEDAHPALVSRSLWQAAQAMRGLKPVHTGSYSAQALLRGIVTCEACGHKMVVGGTRGRTVNGKREKLSGYYCRNPFCPARAYVNAAELDQEVWSRIQDHLKKAPRTTTPIPVEGSPEHRLAEADLAEAEAALVNFKANRRALALMGQDEWTDVLEDLILARDLAREAVTKFEPKERIRTPEKRLSQRRDFLQAVIRSLTVRSAQRRRIPVAERLTLDLEPVEAVHLAWN